jgi:hypothetical protein
VSSAAEEDDKDRGQALNADINISSHLIFDIVENIH